MEELLRRLSIVYTGIPITTTGVKIAGVTIPAGKLALLRVTW